MILKYPCSYEHKISQNTIKLLKYQNICNIICSLYIWIKSCSGIFFHYWSICICPFLHGHTQHCVQVKILVFRYILILNTLLNTTGYICSVHRKKKKPESIKVIVLLDRHEIFFFQIFYINQISFCVFILLNLNAWVLR